MTESSENTDDKDEERLESLISKLLLSNFSKPDLSEDDICYIVDCTIGEMKKGNALLDLEPPLTICGDTHGQFHDVLRIFHYNGWPPEMRYLFLGDYVDRGDKSVETVCLMFLFKLRHPNDFYILRGNHECSKINRVYGFYDECKERYNVRLWYKFQKAFDLLPIAAIVADRIFCTHGGLSPNLKNFNQIRTLRLPLKIPRKGLVSDLLWSDPTNLHSGWKRSERGKGFTFGEDVIREFCRNHDIELICRGHQVAHKGYRLFANGKLATIFSAPNYSGELSNSAGLVRISKTLHCKFKQLKLKPRRNEQSSQD